ncbi:phosphatase PAP2 family protein [Chitinophagaceae bacterium LB-8]|uniref:Phosphatase PAP2 family protein n=1 Tax=Paraflavisolibacter caeni TaxID=2982496 RepID=A0A9X2Y079_9BACT|nr:phosphatase PAP2 family protein [Paraflavisolibacter caeni]MCU7551972.1 phosphatase PAP2 family protein [Paraflavisolibacter caeni]
MQSSKTFTKAYFKKLPLRLILLLIFFIGAVFLLGLIIHEVIWEKEEAVDNYIFNFLAGNVITPGLTNFMKVVTYFASSTFLQLAYGCLVLLYLFRMDYKRAAEIAVIGGGGFLVNHFMKLSFQRNRPLNPLDAPLSNFSFPSGHATSGFIFYGLMVYLIWKANLPKTFKYIAGSALILFALLIGFSRVYLRMHYPTDVAAGFCVGFAWLSLSVWLMGKIKKKTDQELQGQ